MEYLAHEILEIIITILILNLYLNYLYTFKSVNF